MAQQGQHRRPKPPRIASLQLVPVHPTHAQQLEYNHIREEEDRQASHNNIASQSDDNSLRLPPVMSSPLSRTSSNDSRFSASGPSAAAISPPGQRWTSNTSSLAPDSARKPGERGKRKRALTPAERVNVHIHRKLKLVCPDCRARKVKCNHYDLSELERGYQTYKQLAQQPNNASPVSPSLSYIANDVYNRAPDLASESPAGDIDLTDPSPLSNTRPHVLQVLDDFDVRSVTFHDNTMPSFSSTYDPGLEWVPRLGQDSSRPFVIGSDMDGYPNRWQCEFASRNYAASVEPAPAECYWTGSLDVLNYHFRSEHHPFRNPEVWWQCRNCASLYKHSVPPAADEGCQHRWKRWYYGYLTESSTASTSIPAVTASVESESAFSFDEQSSAPWDQTSCDDRGLPSSGWDIRSTNSGSIVDLTC